MPVLRLTSKLLAQIDTPPSPDGAPPSPFGDWYGHLFTLDRRKCVLFINEPTLFVCLALDVVKAHYRQVIPFFIETLASSLRVLPFGEDERAWIVGTQQGLTVGPTLNRSTVGSLNNRIQDAKTIFDLRGGFGLCGVDELVNFLNETPMKPIGYCNGLEKMRELIAGVRK